MNNPLKWAELAAKAQADVIRADAADPGVPISAHDAKRAVLHTRHDMVMVTLLLVTLNNQAEGIDRKARSIVRLLWTILAVVTAAALLRG